MARATPLIMKLAMPVSPYPTFPRKREKGQTNRYASFTLIADHTMKAGDEKFFLVRETGSSGCNASTEECGDLIEMGALDPVKVTRSALHNSASPASPILIMGAIVAELPKKVEKPCAMDERGMQRASI